MSDENENEPETFPRSYVEELRAEAAEHRVKSKENAESMETFRNAYRAAVLKEATRDVLAEPIPWSDDFDGENGLPDAGKIREAAEALALEKPQLARVRGDIGQGFRGEQDAPVDLAGMLRAGA